MCLCLCVGGKAGSKASWRELSTQLQEAFKQAEAGKHLGGISHKDSFSKWLPGLEDL